MAQDAVFVERAIDWAYKLSNYSPGFISIVDSKYDVIIMDHSFYGGTGPKISVNFTNNLKFKGACKRKIVLANIVIGEAEGSRFYFKSLAPTLKLNEPILDASKNIDVRFWDEKWQNVIFGNNDGENKGYIDRIIDAGFDGVCMDAVNAYKFWETKEINGNIERRSAASDMIDFVVKIADYARNIRGKSNFIIITKNGEGLIDPASYSFANDPVSEANRQKQRYLNAINAVVAEDVFFAGNEKNDNPLNVQTEKIRLLDMLLAAGKNVFIVDYLNDEKNIDTFYKLAREHGYVPYATNRDLNVARINNNHEPICNDTLTTPLNLVQIETEPETLNNTEENETPTHRVPPGSVPHAFPCSDKKFIVKFDKKLNKPTEELNLLSLKIGETVRCTLIANRNRINNNDQPIKVSTILNTGKKVSINVIPNSGLLDKQGEFMFTLRAIALGIDWVAWSINNSDKAHKPEKRDYDEGNAWGIFVEVRE